MKLLLSLSLILVSCGKSDAPFQPPPSIVSGTWVVHRLYENNPGFSADETLIFTDPGTFEEKVTFSDSTTEDLHGTFTLVGDQLTTTTTDSYDPKDLTNEIGTYTATLDTTPYNNNPGPFLLLLSKTTGLVIFTKKP